MRRFLGVFALLLGGVVMVVAAESDEAVKTRNERLKVKVTVNWKEKQFKDALDELVNAIDDAGKGKLEIKFSNVSMNTKVKYSAKDKTVAEVLDGVLGKDMGYVIKADGGLIIRPGMDRGGSEDAKGKTVAKADPKDKAKDKTKDKPEPKDKPEAKPKVEPKDKPEPTADDKEKQAASKLDLIKMLVDSGKKEKAKERLEELIKAFEGTKAAGEAKTLLDKLKE